MQLSSAEFRALLQHIDPNSNLARKISENIINALGGEEIQKHLDQVVRERVERYVAQAFTTHYDGIVHGHATRLIQEWVARQLHSYSGEAALKELIRQMFGDTIREEVRAVVSEAVNEAVRQAWEEFRVKYTDVIHHVVAREAAKYLQRMLEHATLVAGPSDNN